MSIPDGDTACEGRKIIRPLKLNGSGYVFGEPAFPNGKPLYNLDRIAADQAAPVWITEGEKAADALTKLGAVATTSGGADSASKADWTPLRGRRCYLWPDNDDAGREYAGNVAAILIELGCMLSAVDVDKLVLPPKGDAWDWVHSLENASLDDLNRVPRVDALMPPARSPGADLRGSEWPVLDEAALHGIAGEIVRAVEPHTEADPAAILMQVLCAFGVYTGRCCYVPVEGDKHFSNLFALIVGNTSKGRKGTSWGRVKQVFEMLPAWPPTVSGLSSGEGLKWHVRDASGDGSDKKLDIGATDKRVLVIESEFAQVLRATARNGNTLSATVREAWDTGNLRTLTRNDPIVATDAHVGVIGHITVDELRSELTATDRANGFANRFLFVCAKRSKILPFGGGRVDLTPFTDRLERAASAARQRSGALVMDDEARDVWASLYPTLSEGHAGLLGAVTGRAEAQCVRLALCYALLDEATAIGKRHLLAAIALWNYCDASARFVFGSALGYPLADEILRALRAAGTAGMTRTEISDYFRRHESAERVGNALEYLNQRKLAMVERSPTKGRAAETWKGIDPAK